MITGLYTGYVSEYNYDETFVIDEPVVVIDRNERMGYEYDVIQFEWGDTLVIPLRTLDNECEV